MNNYECNVDDELAQSDSEDEIEVFDSNEKVDDQSSNGNDEFLKQNLDQIKEGKRI